MGKRKRDSDKGADSVTPLQKDPENRTVNGERLASHARTTIQIIVGTYEKVLHGVQATVHDSTVKASDHVSAVEFADTFLLSSHTSAIRCLALSPPPAPDADKAQRLILASGSSDQVIHLYQISREVPPRQNGKGSSLHTLARKNVVENPGNRELGSLQHHSGSLNALQFPTRSKLLSAAEDNTIAVARTRDWTVLSTIKAPIPKVHGRPSGDTAPHGGSPSGINDFAIHPSKKLMVSVGKGEKCMRLWNLVTGKKAGVLNFERSLLQGVGEGKWASGEGRKVLWNGLGEEFVVAFERGCVVFGIDCVLKCRILPTPRTKVHRLRYVSISADDPEAKEFLAVSTEDGRVLFYSTQGTPSAVDLEAPMCEPLAQLGGSLTGVTNRIKDFEILQSFTSTSWIVVTGSSDGSIRLWKIDPADIDTMCSNGELDRPRDETPKNMESATQMNNTKQIGQLLGTYEAANRITCLTAFLMVDRGHLAANGIHNASSNLSAKPDSLTGANAA